MSEQHSRLDQLVVRVRRRDEVLPVFQAICGGEPESSVSEEEGIGYTRFRLGPATVELVEPLNTSVSTGRYLTRILKLRGPGMHILGLRPADLSECVANLRQINARLVYRNGYIYVHPDSANGVLLRLAPGQGDNRQNTGDAHFDHVAVRVKDLKAASHFWERVTGVDSQYMGLHPVANGTFKATRFLLSNQMVELICPVTGEKSGVADRMLTHGEGIQTVALIAREIEVTLERIRKTGARLLWQDPHWFVHPKDTAGLLLQLTPRVAH